MIWLFAFPGKADSQNSMLTDSSRLNKFLPDYVKFQYAGGIGFISTGAGYTFFNDKLDVSFFYSYVPYLFSDDDLHSVSFQFTSRLLHYNLSENIEVLPLNIGFFIHHTFGNKYWIRQPAHYPDNYYWWAPGRNAGLSAAFLGSISALHISHDCGETWEIGLRTTFLVSELAWVERQYVPVLLLATEKGLYELAIHEDAQPFQVLIDPKQPSLGFYSVAVSTDVWGGTCVAVAARYKSLIGSGRRSPKEEKVDPNQMPPPSLGS